MFCFEAMWIGEKECKHSVESVWAEDRNNNSLEDIQ